MTDIIKNKDSVDTSQLMLGNIISDGVVAPIELTHISEKELKGNYTQSEVAHLNPVEILSWQAVHIGLNEDWLKCLGYKRWNSRNGSVTYSKNGVILHKRKRGWIINKSTKQMDSVSDLQNYHLSKTGKKLRLV